MGLSSHSIRFILATAIFFQKTAPRGSRSVESNGRGTAGIGLNTREDLYRDITEDVPNFFEDLGSLLYRSLLNEDLAYRAFSYYAKGWWSVSRPYVRNIRERERDSTLFSQFEQFATRMFRLDAQKRTLEHPLAELDADEQETFLREELGLPLS
jgi:hypothetical protein